MVTERVGDHPAFGVADARGKRLIAGIALELSSTA
jgi:hypothetical protein